MPLLIRFTANTALVAELETVVIETQVDCDETVFKQAVNNSIQIYILFISIVFNYSRIMRLNYLYRVALYKTCLN